VRTRTLHGAVIPGHGHGDEAHHDGARLRCGQLVSASLCDKIRVGASGRAAMEPFSGGEVVELATRGASSSCVPFLAMATCDCGGCWQWRWAG
jgi:hypothetical protein